MTLSEHDYDRAIHTWRIMGFNTLNELCKHWHGLQKETRNELIEANVPGYGIPIWLGNWRTVLHIIEKRPRWENKEAWRRRLMTYMHHALEYEDWLLKPSLGTLEHITYPGLTHVDIL